MHHLDHNPGRYHRSLWALRACAVLLTAAAAWGDNVQYTYDTAGRLTSANYGSGHAIYYAYDPAGNLLTRKIIVITDTDNDGMEDAWELEHFQTLARDGTGDLDVDRMSDRDEYLAGTDPDDAASTLHVLRVEHSTELPVTESLRVINDTATVSWHSVPGQSYKVQYKLNLTDTNWTDLAAEQTATGVTSSQTDGSLAPQRFYRVVQTGMNPGHYATVSWAAVSGKTYRVQFKQALTDPFWTDLSGDVTAAGSVASRSDVAPDSNTRFYRVMLLP